MPTAHRLDAGAQTVHWGYFDARLEPRLTVDSGDSVTISTVSGPREVMPPPPLAIPAALAEVQARVTPKFPGHMCTGPLTGALPDDYATRHLMHIVLDRARMVGRMPWGLELPLRPFFGVMAVAPP